MIFKAYFCVSFEDVILVGAEVFQHCYCFSFLGAHYVSARIAAVVICKLHIICLLN